ncbi:hypothetical protein TTHERM_00198520 (macronuclear) [Tetrahymena thermophila SB210]|uniref:Transmembrane protein n=1 Tax=Tetrahymena thermophila (strain SB210) TaxID=312017 RepID=Q22NJ7_TETTS|nr:hypothetical protein TTHERM_00198520 [Tetrahymena thermophila SB210]EAR86788.1 hypothetical protein TTHERM_00198520 [Tetrahymena thermophila SB210]|eukprot:XP_001007033.1 hypothetical protein TTHERM_00198520 [Tetrahymena thermophila SB210]
MKALILLAIIVLNTVQCVETPSWLSQSAFETSLNCVSALKTPDCIDTTCIDAAVAYSLCIFCQSYNGSYSSYLNCAKDCATIFINDPTTKDNTTVAAYANGYTSCIQAINGQILALSTFFLAVFALLF